MQTLIPVEHICAMYRCIKSARIHSYSWHTHTHFIRKTYRAIRWVHIQRQAEMPFEISPPWRMDMAALMELDSVECWILATTWHSICRQIHTHTMHSLSFALLPLTRLFTQIWLVLLLYSPKILAPFYMRSRHNANVQHFNGSCTLPHSNCIIEVENFNNAFTAITVDVRATNLKCRSILHRLPIIFVRLNHISSKNFANGMQYYL